ECGWLMAERLENKKLRMLPDDLRVTLHCHRGLILLAANSVDDRQSGPQTMSDIEPREPVNRRLGFYSLVAFLPTILVIHIVLSNPRELFANAQKGQPSSAGPGTPICASTLAHSLSLRCVLFAGYLYAIADIDLRLQKIIFTISNDGKRETFPEVV